MARKYRYLDEAKYPPFNPNVPVTTDISDQEKRYRGIWHIQNARQQGLDRSILISAFNDAKARGFSDNQAYEYVRDVAASKGWSEQGGYDVGRRTYETAKQVGKPALDKAVKEDKERIDRLAKFSHKLNTGLALLGEGLMYTKIGSAPGIILQIPATIEDTYNLVTNPTVANGIDEGMNVISPIPQIPGKYDDFLRSIGLLYDAYDAARGNSLAEDIENAVKKKKSLKRTKGR